MNILFQSAFLINRQEETIENREINESVTDFGNYVQQLVNKIETHAKTRAFKKRSDSTEVISIVNNIINLSELNNETCMPLCTAIATRFLHREIEAQTRNQMIDMQNGSLIIVVFEQDEITNLLIAKIAHNIFIDETDYSSKNGFEIENVSHWKTCVFEFVENDDIYDIDKISIFLNHPAKYWHDSFIEVDEMNTNEKNTDLVFNEVLKVINRNTADMPSERFDFKNSLIGYMKQDRLFNYDDLVSHLIDNHDNSALGEEKVNLIRQKLMDLPETKNFDKQFTTVPTRIKSRRKVSKFNINPNVELVVKDYIKKKEDISAIEREGKRYLVIRTNDADTYNTFK